MRVVALWLLLVLGACGHPPDGTNGSVPPRPGTRLYFFAWAMRYGPYEVEPPSRALSGRPFSVAIAVGVPAGLDPAPDTYAITVELESSENAATLGGTTTKYTTRRDGFDVVVMDDLTLDRWGQASLVISSPGVPPLSFELENRASQFQFIDTPLESMVGEPLQLRAALTDVTGSTDLGADAYGVTWCINSPTTTGCPTLPVHYPQAGVVSLLDVIPWWAGVNNRITLRSELGFEATTTAFELRPGPPAELHVIPESEVTRNVPFAVDVRLLDAFGNRTTAADTVELSLSGPNVDAQPVAQLSSAGAARFEGLVAPDRAPYTITAHVAGLPDASAEIFASSWRRQSTQLVTWAPYHVAVAPDDPDTVYLSSSSGIINIIPTSVSHDRGVTWTALGIHGALTIAPTPGTLYSHTNNQVLKSVNGGATWTVQLDLDDSYMFGEELSIDPVAPAKLYMPFRRTNYEMGIWRSLDAGETWSLVGPSVPQLGIDNARRFGSMVIEPGGLYITGYYWVMETMFTFREVYDLWKSTDDGTSWTQVTTTGLFSDRIYRDPSATGGLYTVLDWRASNPGGIARSVDGGATWTTMSSPVPCPSGSMTKLVVDPLIAGRLLALCAGWGVLVSSDSGATWPIMPPWVRDVNRDPNDVAFAPSAPDVAYSCGEGVFHSVTRGE